MRKEMARSLVKGYLRASERNVVNEKVDIVRFANNQDTNSCEPYTEIYASPAPIAVVYSASAG
jgi:hypothetical protein